VGGRAGPGGVGGEHLPALPTICRCVDGAPAGSSWGLWGDGDRFGCLNLLTPERALAASSLVERGAVFALDADLATPDPPLFGRSALRHEVTGVDDGPGHDDVLHGWNTQGSTQWDGFRHVRHPVHGWYGGAPEGFHGVDAWAERGLVGRAILADVARWREDQGRPIAMDEPDAITADELVATLDAQGTVPEVGDVLLVRTGWLGWYSSLDVDDPSEMASGTATPACTPTSAPPSACGICMWRRWRPTTRRSRSGPLGSRTIPTSWRPSATTPAAGPRSSCTSACSAARPAHRRALRARRSGRRLRRRGELGGLLHLGAAQPAPRAWRVPPTHS
jgi:hypothetical protein